jgi:serine/threonine protein kinase
VVEIVKCKRIYLARKTIFCSKRFTKQQAIEEVAHLEKIQHSHIVRVIGTYTIANEFSILLYPVAEYNLESFLQELRDHCDAIDTVRPGYLMALKDFFGCLSNAVAFIHSKMTKHMDIKPKNILVRKVYGKSSSHQSPWKVYIADFGIARSYSSIAASETEGPTMFTRRYAAPEVVEQDRRGLQADIFSLGCVFVEIGATIAQIHPNGTVHSAMSVPVEDLDERLASNGNSDSSYHANIRTVQEFIHQLNLGKILRYYLQFRLRYAHDIIAQMLEPYPTNRPTARVVAAYFGGGNTCCQDLPDPLEDNPPKMHEEFDRHLKDHNMWGKLNKVHRPPSPVNLGGEKNSSYRMSSLSLHSTSNLNY